MINLVDILKHEMVGRNMVLRSINKNKARFLYHDAETEQDIIAVLYFDEGFNVGNIHGVMYFSELVQHQEHGNNVRLRCEVRQL